VTSNRTVKLIIRYLGKPILVGLCAAALILLVFPEIRQQNNGVEQSPMDLDGQSHTLMQ
jgi:serine protease DegS